MLKNTRAAMAAIILMAFTQVLLAAPGFFSSVTPPAPNSPTAREVIELFKLAPGCNLNVTVGDHYKTFTNVSTGQSATMTFFDDGRVASLETAKGKGIVLYDAATHRPTIAVNVNTGQSVKLDTAKGSEMYRMLRAQGRLPTPEKIVAQLCSIQKTFLEISDSLDSLLSSDYWNDMESSYYGDFVSFYVDDPLKDCLGNLIACLEECDGIADVAYSDCAAYGFVTGLVFGPEIGVAIGALCASAATSNKWACQDSCHARYPC